MVFICGQVTEFRSGTSPEKGTLSRGVGNRNHVETRYSRFSGNKVSEFLWNRPKASQRRHEKDFHSGHQRCRRRGHASANYRNQGAGRHFPAGWRERHAGCAGRGRVQRSFSTPVTPMKFAHPREADHDRQIRKGAAGGGVHSRSGYCQRWAYQSSRGGKWLLFTRREDGLLGSATPRFASSVAYQRARPRRESLSGSGGKPRTQGKCAFVQALTDPSTFFTLRDILEVPPPRWSPAVRRTRSGPPMACDSWIVTLLV